MHCFINGQRVKIMVNNTVRSMLFITTDVVSNDDIQIVLLSSESEILKDVNQFLLLPKKE